VHHTSERERKTHTQRAKRASKLSASLYNRRRNEREKTNLDWKKPAKPHRRNKERFAREKQKQNKNNREEETLYITHSVFK